MKNPIREWIARIAREEIYEERRERNLETIKAEINGTHGRLAFAQEHYGPRMTEETKRKAGWSK